MPRNRAVRVERHHGGPGTANSEHDADQLPRSGQADGHRLSRTDTGGVQAPRHCGAEALQIVVGQNPIAIDHRGCLGGAAHLVKNGGREAAPGPVVGCRGCGSRRLWVHAGTFARATGCCLSCFQPYFERSGRPLIG